MRTTTRPHPILQLTPSYTPPRSIPHHILYPIPSYIPTPSYTPPHPIPHTVPLTFGPMKNLGGSGPQICVLRGQTDRWLWGNVMVGLL